MSFANLVNGLFLLLLVSVFYAIGSVLASFRRKTETELLDAFVVAALWIAGLWLEHRSAVEFSLLTWLGVALLLGLLSRGLLRLSLSDDSEAAHWQAGEGIWPNTKALWLSFSRKLGNFQGRMLLILFYFFLTWPFAILVRLTGRSVTAARGNQDSYWRLRQTSAEQ